MTRETPEPRHAASLVETLLRGIGAHEVRQAIPAYRREADFERSAAVSPSCLPNAFTA